MPKRYIARRSLNPKLRQWEQRGLDMMGLVVPPTPEEIQQEAEQAAQALASQTDQSECSKEWYDA